MKKISGKVMLSIGLLSLTTFSACVHTKQEMYNNRRQEGGLTLGNLKRAYNRNPKKIACGTILGAAGLLGAAGIFGWNLISDFRRDQLIGKSVDPCDLSTICDFGMPEILALTKMAQCKNDSSEIDTVTEAFGPYRRSNLINAVSSGDINDIQSLICEKVNLDEPYNSTNQTVLMYALINKKAAAATLLINNGANVTLPDNEGKTALMYAAMNPIVFTGQKELTPTGIKEYHRLDYIRGSNAACIVNLLIDKGADVHGKDKKGNTALMHAAMLDATCNIKLLIEKGSDCRAKNWDGSTAFMLAAEHNRTNTLLLLIDYDKGIIDEQDYSGKTALIHAVENNHFESIRILLAYGADRDIPDNEGKTALMFAAEKGNSDIVRMLIEKKAKRKMIDKKGKTALAYAIESHNNKTIQLLK